MTREERIAKKFHRGGLTYVGIFELLQVISKEKFGTVIVINANGWAEENGINLHIRSWNNCYSNGIYDSPFMGCTVGYIRNFPSDKGEPFVFNIYTVTQYSKSGYGGCDYNCICKKTNSMILYFDKYECDFLEYKSPSFRERIARIFKPKLNKYSVMVTSNNDVHTIGRFNSATELIIHAQSKTCAVFEAKINKGSIVRASCVNSNVRVQDLSQPLGYNDCYYLVDLKQ